jgi:thiosulfate dehydrogenase [quinone] large subunit
MDSRIIEESPVAKFLFSNTRLAWFWLLVRIYVGWQWLEAGWAKVTSDAWVGAHAGTALTGFLNSALGKVGGAHPDVQSWYGSFIEHAVIPHAHTWSYFVAFGEVAVGVALILGFLTGIAAFFGLFMNLNFLLAGSVSVNPMMFTLSIGLILAWRIAGYLGVDRIVLPLLGTPWWPGRLFRK